MMGCTPKTRFARLKTGQLMWRRKTPFRRAIRPRVRRGAARRGKTSWRELFRERRWGASDHARPGSENRSTGGRCRSWKRPSSARNGAWRRSGAMRLRLLRLSDEARELAKVVQADRCHSGAGRCLIARRAEDHGSVARSGSRTHPKRRPQRRSRKRRRR